MADDELLSDDDVPDETEPAGRSDLIDPSPLPSEVAMDEPPVGLDVLEMVMAPATTEDLRKRREEAVDAAVEAVKRWEITDEASAEWAGGRFTEMTDAIADVDREHKQYLARLARWREMRVAPLERFRSLLEAKLIEFGQRRREETKGKIKTVALPSATVSSRGGQDRYDVTDEEKLIAWLEANVSDKVLLAAAVKSKKSILKGGLAAVLPVDKDGNVFDESTGEKVPGVEFHKATASYKVAPR